VLATSIVRCRAQTAESLAAQVAWRRPMPLAQSELDRAQRSSRAASSPRPISIARPRRATPRMRASASPRRSSPSSSARNGRLDIRAPAAGLVLTRAGRAGQIVSSGSGVLFRMAKGGEMEMRAQLSEADLQAAVGVAAQVTPVGSDPVVHRQVWQVSPVIDPQTRQGIARIALSYNPALRPGGFASARSAGGSTDAPQLPNSAIQSDSAAISSMSSARHKVVRRDVKHRRVTDTASRSPSGLNRHRARRAVGRRVPESGTEGQAPVLQKKQG
jgi:multidrug efflux pump subunit AcrA (membrane-fusion protein)